MAEAAVSVLKFSIKMGYALTFVLLVVVFLGLGISFVGIALNGSVVLDIAYLIQMWLPFNLAPIFAWISVSVTAYFAMRLYAVGFSILRGVLD